MRFQLTVSIDCSSIIIRLNHSGLIFSIEKLRIPCVSDRNSMDKAFSSESLFIRPDTFVCDTRMISNRSFYILNEFRSLQSFFSNIRRDDLYNLPTFSIVCFPSPSSTFIRVDTISQEYSILHTSNSRSGNDPVIPYIVVLIINKQL